MSMISNEKRETSQDRKLVVTLTEKTLDDLIEARGSGSWKINISDLEYVICVKNGQNEHGKAFFIGAGISFRDCPNHPPGERKIITCRQYAEIKEDNFVWSVFSKARSPLRYSSSEEQDIIFDQINFDNLVWKEMPNTSISSDSDHQVWIEKTKVKGRPHRSSGPYSVGQKLWSPLTNKRGADIYKAMREVRKGDVVLHLIDNEKIIGRSLVWDSHVTNSYNPTEDEYQDFKSFYEVPLFGYYRLKKEIMIKDFLSDKDIKEDLLRISNQAPSGKKPFFTSKLKIGEGGYLTRVSNDLFLLLDQNYDETGFSIDPFHKRKIEKSNIGKNLMDEPKNIILYGPPGTGKTYSLQKEFLPSYQSSGSDRFIFTTFHQSYSYEEFVEGIRPILSKNEGGLKYEITEGPFKKICKRALQDPDNRYAIFIDEINRGNVSKILGELITLIETDKRKGNQNEASANLLYSGDEFSVPNNLDIIGTMNTADRSLTLLDSALRRRFDFQEIKPDPSLLGTIDGIDLSKLLISINLRIEYLEGKDRCIGHSYFMNVKNIQDIKNVFKNNLIPLLSEYFYDDWKKIQLIFRDIDESENLPNSNQIIVKDTKSSEAVFGMQIDDFDDLENYYVSENITKEAITKIYEF